MKSNWRGAAATSKEFPCRHDPQPALGGPGWWLVSRAHAQQSLVNTKTTPRGTNPTLSLTKTCCACGGTWGHPRSPFPLLNSSVFSVLQLNLLQHLMLGFISIWGFLKDSSSTRVQTAWLCHRDVFNLLKIKWQINFHSHLGFGNDQFCRASNGEGGKRVEGEEMSPRDFWNNSRVFRKRIDEVSFFWSLSKCISSYIVCVIVLSFFSKSNFLDNFSLSNFCLFIAWGRINDNRVKS